jgi:hypothetical protein
VLAGRGSCALDPPAGAAPWVVLVIGVNGVGKTTMIGKLAARERSRGRSVLVVAADTFRAAAADQLAVWAERAGAGLVRQKEGADPAAVAFDGVQAAVARGIDTVFVDTADACTRSKFADEWPRSAASSAARPGAPHTTLLAPMHAGPERWRAREFGAGSASTRCSSTSSMGRQGRGGGGASMNWAVVARGRGGTRRLVGSIRRSFGARSEPRLAGRSGAAAPMPGWAVRRRKPRCLRQSEESPAPVPHETVAVRNASRSGSGACRRLATAYD